MPEAEVKIFLTAGSYERAKRRYAELIDKGETVTFEQVYADLLERDKKDSSREANPLKPVDDAIILNTTDMSLDGVLEELYCICAEKLRL